MARFGFCAGTYTSQSPNFDAERCMNLYPETNESGQGKSPVALYPTPGLQLFCSLDGVCRGQIEINGRYFAVGSSNFYEINDAGTVTLRGSGVFNDTLPASMTCNSQQIFFCSGGFGHVFNLGTNTFTSLPSGDFGVLPIQQVGYIDGFFLAYNATAQQIWASAPFDATTWPSLSTTIVSVFPGYITSMLCDHREMWVWGNRACAVYYDSGNAPFPFDVVPGGFIEQGCIATFSTVRMDNSVFWLGNDERGKCVAWRANGYTPVRVSNHAVEFAWSQYLRPADCVAYSYQDQGHSFWVLNFRSDNATWVYDAATSQWHERGEWNGTAYTAHKSWNHQFVSFGLDTRNGHFVGDPFTNHIYEMNINFLTDDGALIRRMRRTPHISDESEWAFHHQLQVDIETGLGPTFPSPTIFILNSGSNIWFLQVNNLGILQTTPGSGISAQLLLNDSSGGSWIVGVTPIGVLTTMPTSRSTYPTFVQMVSTDGSTYYNLQITTIGLLQTIFAGFVLEGPPINLLWSDDGGHTWGNTHPNSLGAAGSYKTRVIWRRLGRTRDRVYEINCNAAAFYRFVDAYLMATPGYTPTTRIVHQLRKSA